MSKQFWSAATAALLTSHAAMAAAQETVAKDDKDSAVFLRADRLIDDKGEGQIIAEGNVEARFGERLLRADRVIYLLEEESVRAQGNVQIIESDGSVRYADEIQVDEDLENGYALNFSSRMQDGAVARASAAVRKDGSINALEQMVYTACPLCEGRSPTWEVRARRAVQNQRTQMISYRDAVIEVKGVPVFYLPYFAHPDPSSERRSGLLPPDLGTSSKVGAYYEQPYYWAMSPYQDLTFKPKVMENVNPLMGLEYRKRFFSGYVAAESSFTNERNFDGDGEKFDDQSWRSHIFADGAFAINDDWKWGFGLERQSDDLYDRRYDIDGVNDRRGLYASQSRQLLSQLYSVGQTESMYTEAGIFSFQGLRATDDPTRTPLVAPMLFTEKYFSLGRLGDISLAGSTAVISRDEGLSTARATVDSNWRQRSIFGPGLVLEPFAELRADVYDVKDTDDIYKDQTLSRVIGLGGAQLSWPLISSSGPVSVIVEPTMMAAWGSTNVNDNDLPNIDAVNFEADETSLFRPNGASNYDLWEGGARYSAGVSATASWGSDNSLSAIFGRRWREEADPAFSEATNLSSTESDYVSAIGLKLGRAFDVETRLRLNKDDFAVQRVDTRLAMSLNRVQLSAQYFQLSKELKPTTGDEGVIMQSRIKLTDRWSTLYSLNRNITENRNIKQVLGFAYGDDCSYFELAYERSEATDRTLGPTEAIQFRFVLKSLGGAGNDTFD